MNYIIAQKQNGLFLLDGQPTRFTTKDLLCKCCGEGLVDERVLRAIRDTETCLGYEVDLNGCARCEIYNKSIGGTIVSSHLFEVMKPSIAIDFEKKDKPYTEIWENAVCNFQRVGVYVSKYPDKDGNPQAYFHGDIKPKRLFWYKDARGYHYYNNPTFCINDFTEKVMKKSKEGEQV